MDRLEKPVVVNIPHAGREIPRWALRDICVPEEEFRLLMDFMTDVDVDLLWDFVLEENKQVATVSRLIVDTERYRNDADEAMAERGMGLYYTHTPEGKVFRRRWEESYQKCLALYDEYHRSLEEKVANCLKAFGKCLILDCHSFHDQMLYTGFRDFPDVCIGVNGALTPEAEKIADAFAGYSVKINEPFAGSLIPMRFLGDDRVSSVMIECNRRIYQGAGFPRVRSICKKIYDLF